ncbi:MAG: PDZ domain-containing protein [Chloroflexi bacterium]|nr:PDZ domain-containing protein [Chloroflexota bacterium]
MGSKKTVIAASATILLVVVMVGAFLFFWQQRGQVLPETTQTTQIMNIGITYLPVTSTVSQYYGLSVSSGALVTDVVPGSLADKAGIRTGDIIVGFNGTKLGEEASLLRMLISCPAGEQVNFEVCRENTVRGVNLLHTE